MTALDGEAQGHMTHGTGCLLPLSGRRRWGLWRTLRRSVGSTLRRSLRHTVCGLLALRWRREGATTMDTRLMLWIVCAAACLTLHHQAIAYYTSGGLPLRQAIETTIRTDFVRAILRYYF